MKTVTYTADELAAKNKTELTEIATAQGVEVKSGMTNDAIAKAILASQTDSPAVASDEEGKKMVANPVEDPTRFDGRLNQPTERPDEVAVADTGGVDPVAEKAKAEAARDPETDFDKRGRAALGR